MRLCGVVAGWWWDGARVQSPSLGAEKHCPLKKLIFAFETNSNEFQSKLSPWFHASWCACNPIPLPVLPTAKMMGAGASRGSSWRKGGASSSDSSSPRFLTLEKSECDQLTTLWRNTQLTYQ